MVLGGSRERRGALEAPEAWERFDRRHVPEASARQHSEDDLADLVDGLRNEVTTSLFITPRRDHLDQRGMSRLLEAVSRSQDDVQELEVIREILTSYGRHVRLRQTVHGLPVVGGEVTVHEVRDTPVAVTGTPFRLDSVSEHSVRRARLLRDDGPATIEARLREEFDVEPDVVDIRLVLLPVLDELRLVRRVRFMVEEPPADVEAFFEYPSGELLLSYNIAAARTGRADAYPVNPLRTPTLESVTLDNLADPDDGRLVTQAIAVVPASPPPLERWGGDYVLKPDDPGFDEVQAYYHVAGAIRYFERYLPGLSAKEPFDPVNVVVNDPGSAGNAFWRPLGKLLLLGDMDERSSARSADMIYHEVGHALSDRICGLQRGAEHTQGRGLAEGYSDYFACSAFSDPRFGDYFMNDADGARRCDLQGLRFAPDFKGKQHATGQVWANVMWDCRLLLGAEHMDAVAVDSLNFLGSASSFEDGRAALLAADAGAHHGQSDGSAAEHAAVIAEAFNGRRP